MRLSISNSAALDARQCRDERALTKSAILVALGGIRYPARTSRASCKQRPTERMKQNSTTSWLREIEPVSVTSLYVPELNRLYIACRAVTNRTRRSAFRFIRFSPEELRELVYGHVEQL
jgi:hypothetical protein